MADTQAGRVVVKIVGDATDLDKSIDGAQKSIGSFGSKAAIGVAAVGAAAIAAGAGFIKLAQIGEASLVADKRIAAINKSMGLFGDQTEKVNARLGDYADKQARSLGVDDDVIKATQAKLLTFKELAKTADENGAAFDRATSAAVDMAAAGFGTAEGNAVQLGKALQDPIKGITALNKSGVTFTETEKEKIKALVESGKTLEAQEMILKAVETQVGGTAAATATGSQKMKVGWDEMVETIGQKLLPVFDRISEKVLEYLPKIEDFIAGIDFEAVADSMIGFIDKAIPVIEGLFNTIKGLIQWVDENKDWLGPIAAAIAGAAVAFGVLQAAVAAYTAVQAILNVVMAANPIGIVIIAIAGLIAAIVYLWNTNEGFRNMLIGVWNSIKDTAVAVFTGIGDFFVKTWDWIKTTATNVWNGIITFFKQWGVYMLAAIFGPIGLLVTFIFKNWDLIKSTSITIFNAIKTTISNIFTGIKNTISNIIGGIKNTISNVFNAIKSAMTNPIDTAKNLIKAGLDKIKGFFDNLKLNLPKIKMPHFRVSGEFDLKKGKVPSIGVDWYNKGGIFNGAQIIGVGEKRPEAVLPLEEIKPLFADAMRSVNGGGNGGITINGDIQVTANTLKDALSMIEEAARQKRSGVAFS